MGASYSQTKIAPEIKTKQRYSFFFFLQVRVSKPVHMARARVLIWRPKFRMKSTVNAHTPGHPESMGEFYYIHKFSLLDSFKTPMDLG